MLTTKEMADKLGIHPESLRRKVRRGDVPVAVRISKTDFRFIEEEVMEALNGSNISRKTDV